MDEIKTFYTWKQDVFPFRLYFNDKKLKIMIIENIDHNYNWLREYKDSINENHYFFVYLGWYHDKWFAKNSNKIFDGLGLRRENFFFMFNSQIEKDFFENFGFKGEVINHNCWLDENIIINMKVDKIYDAVMVARRTAFKRHLLASKVKKLALVCGGSNHGNSVCAIPDALYSSQEQLGLEDTCRKINESKCGLILSASEGACFSSSEYLLCGIPVVSTKSFGGRDIWYNDYNSIICEDNEDSVAEAVEYFVNNPRDALKIRNDHIEQSKVQRAMFVKQLQSVFDKYEINKNAQRYFDDNFFHRMRDGMKPNFDEIFKKSE